MKKLNKLMAALLALVMCLSLLPMAAFAAENPYQSGIEIANGVKDTATKTKPTLDGLGAATNPDSYSNIKDTADGAVSNAGQANEAAEDVTKALEAAQAAVDKVIGEQQQKVDTEHTKDKGVIDGKASEITTKTQEIVTAVAEANKQVNAVNNSLKELETADLSPEEKVAAAKKIQAAADQAKAVADNAKKVADDANAEMEAAVEAANKAKDEYDKFVQAAQGEVDKAKAAELKAKLSDAEAKLNDAEAKAKAAANANAAAEQAKDAADTLLKAAQGALTTAQTALDNIDWPDDIAKDDVNQDAINAKNTEANTAQGKADDLGEEIRGLNGEVAEKAESVETKTDEIGTKTNLITGLEGDIRDFNAQNERYESAKTEYTTTVTTAENAFNQAIETAKQEYKVEANKITDGLSDANGVWGDNQVALEDGKGGYHKPLFYHGQRVNNNEFAYYLKVAEVLEGTTSDSYKELKAYYDQWKAETYKDGSEDKARFYALLIKCEEAVTDNVTNQVIPAVGTRNTAITNAVNTLENKTACKTVEGVNGKINEVNQEIANRNNQIESLNKDIKTLREDITRITGEIADLNRTIGTKTTEKTGYETAAQTAREAAQKLSDLLALKKAMEDAQTALDNAKAAEKTAIEKQREANEALGKYNDAQKAVEKAKAELQAGLKGQLDAEKLSELAAELEAARTAALNAKDAYDDAKNDADQAKKDADQAKADADQAKKDADQELEDFNNRYDGGDDTGDTGTTIDDTLIPLASGPVTRAQFVDYLWRHEGSPAAESELFADHEYAPAIAWALSVEIIGEDFQPDELVTVADVRAILGSFAQVFGTNAVAVAELTTLTGEDGEAVLNCDQVLAEFFGEEYVVPEDLDSLETDTAA